MYATTQLRNEHEGILAMLTVLERIAEGMRQGRPADSVRLAQIVDFLRTFADKCHHGKEEDVLFPALVDAGMPRQAGPVAVMLAEHIEGRAFIAGMADALARMEAGEDAGREFATNALSYVHLLRAHIDKENHVLFMMAERILPAEAHARMAAAFDTIERERIGEGKHEEYHALLQTLQAA